MNVARGLALRRAVPDEAQALAALWRRAWHSANPHVDARDLAPLAHWVNRVRQEFFGAAECWTPIGSELRGFLVIEPSLRHVAQLQVEPAWQGQGLGRRLIEQACERMPAGWSLHVAEGNRRAQHVYAAAGLLRGGPDTDPVTGRRRVAWHWVPGSAPAAASPPAG